jgi:hypothetical protein
MHTGSCHCGRISFEVDGTISEIMECNCSHCSRKGYLLWFVPREQLRLKVLEGELQTYTFNKHVISHHFCPTCGCAPFASGKGPSGQDTAGINVRCLDELDLEGIKRIALDGRSR